MGRGDVRLKTIAIVILSGSCCNPSLASVDEKVKNRIEELATKKQLTIDIKVVSIASVAMGGLGLGKDIGDAVRSLISEKGMSVLPIIIFDTTIAFYGGLASVELIEEKLDAAILGHV